MISPLQRRLVCKNDFSFTETAGLLPARFFQDKIDQWDVRDNLFKHEQMLSQNIIPGSSDTSANHEISPDYQGDEPMRDSNSEDE